jgi:hypothetical protein
MNLETWGAIRHLFHLEKLSQKAIAPKLANLASNGSLSHVGDLTPIKI